MISSAAKPGIFILIAAIVGIITSASIVPIPSAAGHGDHNIEHIDKWHTASGTIASIQNDKNGRPTWILSGDWTFDGANPYPASPQFVVFNATFHMMMLNGSESHMHTIKDFKLSSRVFGYPGWTSNGTVTIIMKGMPVSNVPISITLFPVQCCPTAMKLWIDPTKVMNHFGNTPIYGMWNGGGP